MQCGGSSEGCNEHSWTVQGSSEFNVSSPSGSASRERDVVLAVAYVRRPGLWDRERRAADACALDLDRERRELLTGEQLQPIVKEQVEHEAGHAEEEEIDKDKAELVEIKGVVVVE